jgi:hypothetical protein
LSSVDNLGALNIEEILACRRAPEFRAFTCVRFAGNASNATSTAGTPYGLTF